MEVWKRKNATLAYEWDVDNWEDAEPDRPEFYGLEQKPVKRHTFIIMPCIPYSLVRSVRWSNDL